MEELEPFPLDDKEPLWETGSPQWLERYEYIERRAERYFDAYRDDPKYDFSRNNGEVRNCQTAVMNAYERFATGEVKLLMVQAQVKLLRKAFAKPVATPMTEEEKAAKKPVPQWRRDWEAKKAKEREERRQSEFKKQPSKSWSEFMVRRAYSGEAEHHPYPGVTVYSINANEGWLETGERVEKHLAYLVCLWDCYEAITPEDKQKEKRPEHLIPGYEKERESVRQATSKTLDDLKKEKAIDDHKKDLERLERRLRGRRN